MGKLICDTTASSAIIPWSDPTSAPSTDAVSAVDLADQTTSSSWEHVSGLEDQQKRDLQRIEAKGVLWKHPEKNYSSVVFRLIHGGGVETDGNCLFTAAQKAMGLKLAGIGGGELRRRTVRRFLEDLGGVREEEREEINAAIKHLYSPDLKCGWGVHIVQEVKLLARKEDREDLDSAIDELLHFGVQRCNHMDQMPWSMKKIVSSSSHIVPGVRSVNPHCFSS